MLFGGQIKVSGCSGWAGFDGIANHVGNRSIKHYTAPKPMTALRRITVTGLLMRIKSGKAKNFLHFCNSRNNA
jgi:hypothetical protein